MTAQSLTRELPADTAPCNWRIECRACGAWLVTHLIPDVEVWLRDHTHQKTSA